MIFFDFTYSEGAIYKFSFYLVSIFVLFRILKYVVPLIFLRGDNRKILTKYLPIIEFLIWLFFIFWTIQYFFLHNQLFGIGLFALFIALSIWGTWFVFRDYIFGLIFKNNRKIVENQSIKIGEYEGTVRKLSFRNLVLECRSGKLLQIPYTKIINEVVLLSDEAEMVSSHSFVMQVLVKKDLDDFIQTLKTQIVNLPWSSIKKIPKIYPMDSINGLITLEITVYALEKSFFFRIENYLRETYEKKI